MKRKVVLACKVLYNEGIMDSHGHFSARVPGSDSFLVTPRKSPAFVRPVDLLTVDLDGNVVKGKNPPSEVLIHTTIYKMRQNVGSISHFHSPMAIALALSGQNLTPLYGEGRLFWAGVPIYNDALRIRNPESALRLAKILGDKTAVLLRGHGAVVVGDNIETTCVASIYLEDSAKMQLMCRLMGEPRPLNAEESKEKVEVQRTWNYYVDRLRAPRQLRFGI